jgi:hypothetical protein
MCLCYVKRLCLNCLRQSHCLDVREEREDHDVGMCPPLVFGRQFAIYGCQTTNTVSGT